METSCFGLSVSHFLTPCVRSDWGLRVCSCLFQEEASLMMADQALITLIDLGI